MKRPSLKRKKPAAHERVPADPFGPAPEKPSRFARGEKQPKEPKAPKEKKPSKKKQPKKEKPLTPQEQAAVAAKLAAAPDKQRGRLGGVLHSASAPLRRLGGLGGRTRLVVGGLLAVIVVFGALQLRGGRDDDAEVRVALERYETASSKKDYQTLCDELFASSYVKQTASSGLPCEVALRTALEDVRNPTLEVLSVEVNGDRAAARVRGSAAGQVPGEDVYTLVREDDAWRILPPRPAASSTTP